MEVDRLQNYVFQTSSLHSYWCFALVTVLVMHMKLLSVVTN